MNTSTAGWVSTFGAKDPRIPAAAIEALDAAPLQSASSDHAALAAALAASSETVALAADQVGQAWSAPAPVAGLRSMVTVIRDTATLLQRQSAALAAAAVAIDRVKSNAGLDWTLAMAELEAIRRESGSGLLTAITGVPQISSAHRINLALGQLAESLQTRLSEADAALEELRPVLTADPNDGPDRMHVGPAALLPPDPIGGPTARTDRHNRELLAADLRSGDPARIKFAISITHSLQLAADRGGQAELLVYDPTAFDGQGRAAIAVGEVSTASNIAVVVPGIGNSPSDMDGGVTVAANLRDEANRQDPAHPTAVVAWYGYDIPLSAGKDPSADIGRLFTDTAAAASAVNAGTGAPILASDLTSIKAMAQSSTRITLIGFSMGSTTVSSAARYPLPIDALVLLGSPGAGWGTSSAASYRNVPASHVYTLSYDQDPVTLPVTDDLVKKFLHLPNAFGPDPAADAFGGNHIAATTNVPVISGTGLVPALAAVDGDPRHHSIVNYTQGAALVAEGAIIVGRVDRVPTKRGRPRR